MKKIFGIFAITAIFVALFSVSVSAEYLLQQDFSGNDESVMTSLISPDGEGWVREVKDGVLHISNPLDGAMSQSLLLDNSFDGETILQFDLKMDNPEGYLIIQIYRGGERGRYGATFEAEGVRAPVGSSGSAHEPGVWYTYIYHMKADTMDIYRKERDSQEPFKQVLSGIERTTNTSPAQLQPYCAKGMDASLDNIKVYTGTFAENPVFEVDGNVISSIEDVTSGTLTAKATVVVSHVTSENTDEGLIASEGAAIKPLLVVYNKNHRMIYSKLADEAMLGVGENLLEITVDTSSFADKLKNGYMGFYIWDDFGNLEPLMDAIELK